ncbi:hypothetical protein SAMN02745172_02715 [Pseudoxanthobacter soli DSM 19599]|uniref:DUF4136 domain-containing protein n=1 Tax=Pseudoxanthobacter soli DSM 19599 TaxID=1123029 RepID=A0A1M7ZMC3_9HYPH|nr:hypothetical protein [Pseudoxanthobacter soli]SHO66064.1 hypothetical protein SAMN02745172_02715 [Pseudoxanthobacter soli DSM 19599]
MPMRQSMPRRLSRIAILLGALLLAACAGPMPTPYGPAADGFGFSQTQIARDRWRVAFTGNPATSPETVDSYLLRRAAQLTLEQGGDYFVVEGRSITGAPASVAAVRSYPGGVSIPPSAPQAGPVIGVWGGVATLNERSGTAFTAQADIRIHRGAAPAGDPAAFDARRTLTATQPPSR